MGDFDVILFDIGGVLVDIAGVPRLLEWAGKDVDREKLLVLWGASKAVHKFETGNSNSIEFSKSIVTELNLSVTCEQFIEEFEYFTKELYPGAKELLNEISKFNHIACFSNTNELQWTRLCREFNINNLFHKNFLSYEMSLMKPDKNAYIHVINELGCEPDRILFFDDSQLNVNMGNEVGMIAHRVSGINELTCKLKEFKLLGEKAI